MTPRHRSSGLPHPPARTLLTPAYAAGIWLETRLASEVPSLRLRFPRNLAEIEAEPERLFALLRQGAVVPGDAAFVELRRRGRMENEPDKDRTAAAFDVVARHGDETTVVPVFVKFQSGRGMPLLLQAVRAAVEPGVAREVDFYRELASTVPVRSPRPYFVDSITALNRVCLVLEHVEGYNPADWRGAPLSAVRAMLADVARLNAAFVGRTVSDSRTRWIPARVGLDFASYVATLGASAPAWHKRIWKALESYFRDRPVTLVHGDCRPGNMLFRGIDAALCERGGGELDAAPWPDPTVASPEVVFADWEAINVAPLLWDFTYCTIIGLRVADRRVHLPRLLDEFVASLRAAGVSPRLCEPGCCRTEVDLLSIVLYFISALIASKGYWDEQGNTLDDHRAWSERVLAALRAVDAPRAAEALGIPADLLLRLQREAAFEDREPAPSARVPTADPVFVNDVLRASGDAGWLALTEHYGRVFRLHGGVVTSEPEHLQAILNTRAHTLRRPALHRLADRFVPGAAGILFKDGEAWKRRLRPLSVGFQPQKVAAGEARMREQVERHVEAWPATHTGPDLFAEISRIGLQVALVEGYNLDPGDPVVQAFGATLLAYKARTMNPDRKQRLDEFGLTWRKARDLSQLTLSFRDLRRHVRRLEALVAELLRRRPWADPAREGWLQVLTTQAGLRGRALTCELNHLYGAFTAADYTATCALAELAHAPEWVDRLRRDGAEAMGAILHETMRRHPVAMVIYRELGEPMSIGAETFPAGTMVMALPYALHHDPAWWDKPKVFDPGRWQRELPPRALTAFEPFLRGPRRCIGQHFACQHLRAVLGTVLRRYDLQLGARPQVNSFIIPRLTPPLRFRFTRLARPWLP